MSAATVNPDDRYLPENMEKSARPAGSTAGLIILACAISIFLCWFYIHMDKKSTAEDHLYGYIKSNAQLANQPIRPAVTYDAPKLGTRMTVVYETNRGMIMEQRGAQESLAEVEGSRLPPGYAQSRAGQPFEGRAPAGYEIQAQKGWRDV